LAASCATAGVESSASPAAARQMFNDFMDLALKNPRLIGAA
jgi:uncharacterized protein YjeT (DUF2065 family)